MPNNIIKGQRLIGTKMIGPSPLAIGDAYGGGYFAGQISTSGNGVADYNLVVAPISTGQITNTSWSTNFSITNVVSVINGPANTNSLNSATYPIAQFCKGLTIGGFTDWYWPARDELEICYYNLKPSTTSNNTGSGINSYAVPARASNYTTSVPAQTTVTAFKSGGAQAFETTAGFGGTNYWSSTETGKYSAKNQLFTNGDQNNFYSNKSNGFKGRAVRRVPI